MSNEAVSIKRIPSLGESPSTEDLTCVLMNEAEKLARTLHLLRG